MKSFQIIITIIFVNIAFAYGQERHSFSGQESAFFSTIYLNQSSTFQWSTDRASLPGYFSTTDGATFAGYSDNYNVNGYVKYYHNTSSTSFSYPVGNGTDIRLISVNGAIPINSQFATAWIMGDPSNDLDPTLPNSGPHPITSVTSPIVAVSNIGQWDWQDITNTSAGLQIIVSIPNMTAFSNAINLRLAGWNGSSWIDLSGSATASNNTENSTLSGIMQSGITAIAVATISTVLPVRLTNFNAIPNGCDAKIIWSSDLEINFSRYEIEQSFNGNTFVKIGVVDRNTTSGNSTNNYSFIASQPNGQGYYRLKIIDLDGSFEYSPIISCRTNCNNLYYFVAYPNPVDATTNGIVNIKYKLNFTGKALLRLTDVTGKNVFKTELIISNSANTTTINLNNFANATYIISVTDKNGNNIVTPQRIIKL